MIGHHMYSAMIFLVSERSKFKRSESGDMVSVFEERKKTIELTNHRREREPEGLRKEKKTRETDGIDRMVKEESIAVTETEVDGIAKDMWWWNNEADVGSSEKSSGGRSRCQNGGEEQKTPCGTHFSFLPL
ncbi:unnamed protein product [Microthlaspi erraticum]|uniref:Uncharacterized protein n=1 Tax=Microthlaspi erraticum TaxID=1685480 RepID=A0A6D2JIR6_9BRAS|nr:unnamed protein product [Microthlaspi erraticum]